jgi:hypothetical protein
MRQGPSGPLICFGKIKRDPLTMRLKLDDLWGQDGTAGAIVGASGNDDELMAALERLLVIAPEADGTSALGPMFWSFRNAVNSVVEAGM